VASLVGRFGALDGGKATEVAKDFRRHQSAVLIAALVRLPLDVQHDPAGLRIAVSGSVPLHRFRIGLKQRRLGGMEKPTVENENDGNDCAPHGNTSPRNV